MASEQLIDPALVRKLLSYDAETGRLVWLPRPASMFTSARLHNSWTTQFCGRPAFTYLDPSGYLSGSVLAKKMWAHRVVWAVFYGKWPTKVIDHINGNRQDNRIANLRDTTYRANRRNTKPHPASIQGVAGIRMSRNKERWTVRLGTGNIEVHVGTYDTLDQAIAARMTAEQHRPDD